MSPRLPPVAAVGGRLALLRHPSCRPTTPKLVTTFGLNFRTCQDPGRKVKITELTEIMGNRPVRSECRWETLHANLASCNFCYGRLKLFFLDRAVSHQS